MLSLSLTLDIQVLTMLSHQQVLQETAALTDDHIMPTTLTFDVTVVEVQQESRRGSELG